LGLLIRLQLVHPVWHSPIFDILLDDSRTINRKRESDPDLELGNAIIDDRTTTPRKRPVLRHG
jgi:hypothetical protein